ncbi:hypothetical protein HDV03_004466 [Kappamyces sp. JEL0829]|nr:hypothetical protein HDV03_004466 [Kappamyces sp. JEL0829]
MGSSASSRRPRPSTKQELQTLLLEPHDPDFWITLPKFVYRATRRLVVQTVDVHHTGRLEWCVLDQDSALPVFWIERGTKTITLVDASNNKPIMTVFRVLVSSESPPLLLCSGGKASRVEYKILNNDLFRGTSISPLKNKNPCVDDRQRFQDFVYKRILQANASNIPIHLHNAMMYFGTMPIAKVVSDYSTDNCQWLVDVTPGVDAAMVILVSIGFQLEFPYLVTTFSREM